MIVLEALGGLIVAIALGAGVAAIFRWMTSAKEVDEDEIE
jgi:hypothetical protein